MDVSFDQSIYPLLSLKTGVGFDGLVASCISRSLMMCQRCCATLVASSADLIFDSHKLRLLPASLHTLHDITT
jgi:hypothetical protein